MTDKEYLKAIKVIKLAGECALLAQMLKASYNDKEEATEDAE